MPSELQLILTELRVLVRLNSYTLVSLLKNTLNIGFHLRHLLSLPHLPYGAPAFLSSLIWTRISIQKRLGRFEVPGLLTHLQLILNMLLK